MLKRSPKTCSLLCSVFCPWACCTPAHYSAARSCNIQLSSPTMSLAARAQFRFIFFPAFINLLRTYLPSFIKLLPRQHRSGRRLINPNWAHGGGSPPCSAAPSFDGVFDPGVHGRQGRRRGILQPGVGNLHGRESGAECKYRVIGARVSQKLLVKGGDW